LFLFLFNFVNKNKTTQRIFQRTMVFPHFFLLTSAIQAPKSFPFRAYAEVGSLLDIPDVGYYVAEPPFVNLTRLAAEVAEVQSLERVVSRLGFNAFMLYVPSIEDFVDYTDLFPLSTVGVKPLRRRQLARGKLQGESESHGVVHEQPRVSTRPVYPPGDPHLARTPHFASAINDTLGTFRDAGLQTVLVTFEPTHPPGLEQRLNLSSWASPDLPRFFETKYCELKRRVPTLTGVSIYVADNWSERADSRFQRSPPIFNGPVEMAGAGVWPCAL
jgi:hypothetical protein